LLRATKRTWAPSRRCLSAKTAQETGRLSRRGCARAKTNSRACFTVHKRSSRSHGGDTTGKVSGSWMHTGRVWMAVRLLGRRRSTVAIGWCLRPSLLSSLSPIPCRLCRPPLPRNFCAVTRDKPRVSNAARGQLGLDGCVCRLSYNKFTQPPHQPSCH
jgi:hypothetical protein